MKKLMVLGILLAGRLAYASGDPLEAAAVDQARGQASDAVQIGDFLRGSGEKTDFQVMLEGNKCYWFSGTSEGLSKLYMYLWAPGAKFFTPRLTDAKTTTGKVTLAHCTTQSGMYKFQVKSEGGGRYVVGVFGKGFNSRLEFQKSLIHHGDQRVANESASLGAEEGRSAKPTAELHLVHRENRR